MYWIKVTQADGAVVEHKCETLLDALDLAQGVEDKDSNVEEVSIIRKGER